MRGRSGRVWGRPGPVSEVSVLLPVRDGGAHLPECIESLERQTLRDVEIVVVDDGSADATPRLLAAWADRDRRVRVVRQERLGLIPALCRGLDACGGRYVARMDADDVAHPERLQVQLRLLESRPDLAGCGCGVRYFPADRVRAGARRYEAWINGLVEPEDVERDAFVECPLAHPTFFLRRDVVEGVGGYRDAGWPEDYDLVLRIREGGGRLANVPRVLHRWREGPERLSRTDRRYSADAFRRCKIHFLLRGPLRERQGAVVWGAGPTGKAFARSLVEAGGRLRAFVDLDPRKIGQSIHGVPVVEPAGVRAYRDALVLAAVGQEGARTEIRRTLTRAGWAEPEEFRTVA